MIKVRTLFSTIKTYLGIAMAATTAVLFGLFKWKSGQLDLAEKRVREQERELRTKEAVEAASKTVHKDYLKEQQEIEEHYDEETITQFEAYTDKPLPPSLLERLRNKEGYGGDTNITPK